MMENRQILRLIYMRQHLQRPEGEHYVNWLEELAILCFGEALFRILEIPEETPKIDADMLIGVQGTNSTKNGTAQEKMSRNVNGLLSPEEKIKKYRSSVASLHAYMRKRKGCITRVKQQEIYRKIAKINVKIEREKLALEYEKV